MARPAHRKPAKPRDPNDKLNDEIRSEIVMRFAMYDTLSEIHSDLLDRGINVTVQSVSHYSPTTNRKMADRWMTLFEETRKQYHAEIAAVPIGNRVWRLRRLQRLYDKAEKKGAVVIAANLLEQAARESGGLFTNTTKVSGRVEHEHTVSEVTPDEKRNMLADRFKEALAARQSATTKH